MAFPAIDAVLVQARVNSAIRELVTDIRYVQQMAMGEGRTYNVIFNTNVQNYRVDYTSYPMVTIVKRVFFPEGLTLLGTNFKNNTISFYITGAPSAAGTIELMDRKGNIIRITVLPATGRVRVYR